MKTLTTLKTLPLIGLLAMGLALAPVTSMADDGDRGRGKDRVFQKHDGGKSHRADRRHFDRGHGYNKGHNKGHKKSHKYVQKHYKGHGHKHYGHRHKVYRPHSHGHGHVDHVVVHDHYNYLSDYDRFRLMLGLHFDNVDIIYRDF
jgi:hypothetical protein